MPNRQYLYILYLGLQQRDDLKEEMKKSSVKGLITLLETLSIVESEGWDKARGFWLKKTGQFTSKEKMWNVWGAENQRIVKYLAPIQRSELQLTYSDDSCNKQKVLRHDNEIVLK